MYVRRENIASCPFRLYVCCLWVADDSPGLPVGAIFILAEYLYEATSLARRVASSK